MIKSFLLILLSVGIGVVGQLCLKVGMTQVGRIGAEQLAQPLHTLIRIFTTPLILLAVPLYAGGFVIWAIVLSRERLSFAYPLFAMVYIFVPLASWLLLGETISLRQWCGIILICLGVVLVGGVR